MENLWTDSGPIKSVEIIKAFNQVGKAVQNMGIWVIELGDDRDYLYESLLKNKKDFIIRLAGSRDLISQDKPLRSLRLAYACRLPYENAL